MCLNHINDAAALFVETEPKPLNSIDILGEGEAALVKAQRRVWFCLV